MTGLDRLKALEHQRQLIVVDSIKEGRLEQRGIEVYRHCSYLLLQL
jgi:hypothetical protein